MRWWLIFILALVACQSPQVRIQQTIDVEFILDDNGDIIVGKTATQRKVTWLSMFANGRYKRFAELDAIEQDTVFANKWNGKITQANIDRAMLDFQNSSMFSQLPNDEIEDVLFFERWPWGTEERKKFPTLLMNMEQTKWDSIASDSIRWFINPLFFRDSLIVCGESFKTLTPRKLSNCVDIPQKVKNWFVNNVDIVEADTPLWNILKDKRGQFKHLWLRHPKFRRYVARWIKKR